MAGGHRPSTAKLSLLAAALSVVCFGQFSDSAQYAAKVVTATGRVSVLKGSEEWALSTGDTVQIKQVIMTGSDGHALFQVTDGSTFEVYPNSLVEFRKNAPTWSDLLDVWLGRVRVHIEHLGNRPNPNRVMTPTAVISVRGTTFDVSVDDENETTLVEVEDGVVDVRHALLPGNTVTLNPGETLLIYRTQPLAQNWIDKGTLWKQVARMVIDAISTIAMHTTRIPSIGGAGGGGGPIGVGDGRGGAPKPPSGPPGLPPSAPSTPPSLP